MYSYQVVALGNLHQMQAVINQHASSGARLVTVVEVAGRLVAVMESWEQVGIAEDVRLAQPSKLVNGMDEVVVANGDHDPEKPAWIHELKSSKTYSKTRLKRQPPK
jgi:hypothetical protein